jgi:cobalt-zinc-cadmium efflux system membrane fusion protein
MTADHDKPTRSDAVPSDVKSRRRGLGGIASSALGSLPTLAVLLVIGGLGWWGHSTGWTWKAPKFADLTGAATVAEKEDWCAQHNVPDSRCIKCHPELVGANMKDWCPEHGVPESKCTLCHPELLTTGVAGDWCPEHGLPESSCTLCHPEIAIKGKAPPSETGATVTMAQAATRPPATPGSPATAPTVAEAGGAGTAAGGATKPAKAKDPKTCQTHAMRVQFASIDAVRKAGVRVGAVVERPMSAVVSAIAEVDYDRDRVAQISSPLTGRAWRVEKQVGQRVKQGEVLALIDAVDVGRAKAELLQALAAVDLRTKTVKRLRSSAESGFRTDAELQEAEAALNEANIRVFNAQQALTNLGLTSPVADGSTAPPDRRTVQFLGLPKELADSLDPKTTTANLLPLLAPFDGVVVQRSVVAGEVVDPTKPLLVVADTGRMWVTADLPLADARRVSLGQRVTFRPDGAPDQGAVGQLSWISTAVDEQTRTLKVRAEVANPDGRLLAHSFGNAQVTVREAPAAVAVPNEALQWEGCCHIVFVRLTEDIFQVRKVKLGAAANGFTEVNIGLLPGEVVATAGSHVLKSELLKSALGAGCCVE